MPEPPAPGAVFAGHRIEGVAGRGGMGVVYRATHIALDHVVALKVISPALAEDERFRRRFAEESRIAVSIRHPNVVPIHHAGEEDGLLFVTMDLIDGTDLRGLLRERATLEPAHAAAIIGEVASALDAAHGRGLVHRDIKPGNILIERHGQVERVFLTDFGLARLVEATTGITATGAFVGTLDYVAPEQIRGERVDARADVYALGCVLFELLTGNPPFAARDDRVAKMYAHLEEDPPSLRVLRPDLPGELDHVIRRALAKDPAERFPSAGDLARAVSAAVEGQPTVEAERSVATGRAAPATAMGTTVAATTAAAAPASAEATDPGELAAPVVHAASAETERRIEAAESPVRRAPPPIPPRRQMRRLALAALGLVAAGIAVVLLLSGGDGNEPGDEASTVAETTDGDGAGGGGVEAPRPAKVVGTVEDVGGLPVELAHGEGGVWVTSRTGGQLTYIDAAAESERIANRIPIGAAPEGVAVAAGSVWVAVGGEDKIVRVKVGDDAPSKEITGFTEPQGVAFGDGSIWVTDSGADELVRVNARTGAIEDTTPVGDGPYGIAFDARAVWVSNRLGGTVSRVPLDGGAVGEFEVGANPKGVAVAGGFVWVAVTDDGVVKQLKPDGGEVDSIDVGSEPRGAVAGFGSVWVAVGGENEVARIDEASGKIARRIAVGAGPEGVTVGPESVWVANGVDGSVSRIDPSP